MLSPFCRAAIGINNLYSIERVEVGAYGITVRGSGAHLCRISTNLLCIITAKNYPGTQGHCETRTSKSCLPQVAIYILPREGG